MPYTTYDIIVVGAGHAGCEAALAAARLGCQTLVITMNIDNIGLMSCNPAVGGIAKGHLVREIDALGGEMARVTDRTGIQFRMLNTSKGPAVRALRAQADRDAYRRAMREVLESERGIDILQGIVEKLLVEDGHVRGIQTNLGTTLESRAVILTTGTFLRGLLHIGLMHYPAGRAGEFPSVALSEHLEKLGFTLGRLKTGTPPRLDARSIDFDVLLKQDGDDPPVPFSYTTDAISRPQISCFLTYTSDSTHEIIRKNLDRSPLYGGVITGIGPRYCPSIEDKVMRFSHKEKHQVFLEPEGYDTVEVYANGISTSLPADVQSAIVRSIKGLEKAEIMRPGYAIEYDFVPPTQLRPTLETKRISGLYHAGQINGTSGYEEAAAQGIVAGINAALQLQNRGPFIIERTEGYIGVLIDDLVTKGTREPYRMFTSRAEHRLMLRHDNADARLTEKGYQVGLIGPERYKLFREKRGAIESEIRRLKKTRTANRHIDPSVGTGTGEISPDTTLAQLLQRPGVGYASIESISPPVEQLSNEEKKAVEIEIKYDGYIRQQALLIEKQRNMEHRLIPPDFDYRSLPGLSTEVKEKLESIRPISLGQASRIPGITPAAVTILSIAIAKQARKKEA